MSNKTKDVDRASTSPTTLFNILYVKMNMTNVESFDPTTSVEYWFNQKLRKPVTGYKSKEQEWYNGVFKEADEHIHKRTTIIKF